MISAVFALALAADPSLADILAAVARSQEQGEKAREQFTFRQETRVRLLRGGGKVAREETRVYDVLPKEKGFDRHLVTINGQYEKGGKLYPYTDPEFHHKKMDIDAELAKDFSEDMGGDDESGGIEGNLFPLTAAKQKQYHFSLAGKRDVRGRAAHVLTFKPIDPRSFFWRGEMLVDAQDLHPLSVATTQNRGMPFLVKSMLGINLKNAGFGVTYAPFDGVWFPVSYGTEFKLRLFFGYARTIAMSLKHSEFKRTKVESAVKFDEVFPE